MLEPTIFKPSLCLRDAAEVAWTPTWGWVGGRRKEEEKEGEGRRRKGKEGKGRKEKEGKGKEM